MKRTILISVLAFGTVAGFLLGFASHRHTHHERWARHLSRVCVDAARSAEESGTRRDGDELGSESHAHRRSFHRVEQRVRELCADEGTRGRD